MHSLVTKYFILKKNYYVYNYVPLSFGRLLNLALI